MITNERQYKITKAQAARFASAIRNYDQDATDSLTIHPAIAAAGLEQLKSEHARLIHELEEYDALASGETTVFEAESLTDLPLLIIKARIARGWTQRDLAERLDIKEQQIQRYEAENYRTASFSTLFRIADALGLQFSEDAHLRPASATTDSLQGTDFPVTEMFRRGWFEDFSGTLREAKRNATVLVQKFFRDAHVTQELMALHRKSVRAGSAFDDAALTAWQVRVILLANRQKLSRSFDLDRLTPSWFRELAKLSRHPYGPLLARDWLLEAGIHFVTEPHLPRTRLDGAALWHPDGNPLVAMTLRHDRLDNFWFVLFHELAHICVHFPEDRDVEFFDDTDSAADELEREADQYALDNLITPDHWEICLSRFSLDLTTIFEEAKQMQIHPAILAGRIRYEQGNHTILNEALGHGQVRILFDTEQNDYS